MSGIPIKPRKLDQQGMAAIFVTLIIMIVLSLVVLGFAQISAREEAVTLDRQLSNQAFDGAESGINDAIQAINNGFLVNNVTGKQTCDPIARYSWGINPSEDGDLGSSGVKNGGYTCLLISGIVKQVQFNDVRQDQSTITPLQVTDGSGNPNPPNHLNISWQNQGSAVPLTTYYNCSGTALLWQQVSNHGGGAYDQPSGTCQAPVLRVDIVKTNWSGGGLNLDALQNLQNTYYFYPINASPGSAPTFVTYNSSGAGIVPPQILPVRCNIYETTNVSAGSPLVTNPLVGSVPFYCKVDIYGIDASQYYVRIRAIYADAQVSIGAYNTFNDTSSVDYIQGSQALIDSTGVSNGVLRRVQVQVPTSATPPLSDDFAIQSTDTICKVIRILDQGKPTEQFQLLAPAAGADTPDVTECQFPT